MRRLHRRLPRNRRRIRVLLLLLTQQNKRRRNYRNISLLRRPHRIKRILMTLRHKTPQNRHSLTRTKYITLNRRMFIINYVLARKCIHMLAKHRRMLQRRLRRRHRISISHTLRLKRNTSITNHLFRMNILLRTTNYSRFPRRISSPLPLTNSLRLNSKIRRRRAPIIIKNLPRMIHTTNNRRFRHRRSNMNINRRTTRIQRNHRLTTMRRTVININSNLMGNIFTSTSTHPTRISLTSISHNRHHIPNYLTNIRSIDFNSQMIIRIRNNRRRLQFRSILLRLMLQNLYISRRRRMLININRLTRSTRPTHSITITSMMLTPINSPTIHHQHRSRINKMSINTVFLLQRPRSRSKAQLRRFTSRLLNILVL